MGKDRKKRRLNAEALLLQSSQTKRLLIFDLNKVLVSKLKNTSIFTIRPFAAEFLHDLSQEYILAVWTSMKKNTAKKIIKSLFQYEAQTKSKSTPKLSQNISSSSSNLSTLSALPLPSLLFKWTQNKCTVSVGSSSRREDEDDIQLDNIARSTRTEIETESVKIENHTHNEAQINNQEQHEVNESKDYDEDCGNEMTESTMVFAKDLTKVWTEFPQYHQFTTILLDDSPEKCYLNPAHSVLHPHPYNGPDMEHSHHDVELKPGNALWKYLLDLAKIPLEDTHSFIQRKPYISPMSKIHT